METAWTSKKLVSPTSLYRWKQHDPLKIWYRTPKPHGVTTQKNSNFHRRENLKSDKLLHVCGWYRVRPDTKIPKRKFRIGKFR